MSSPKRTAKHAIKRAANAASRMRSAPPVMKPGPKTGNGISAEAKRLAAYIERAIADGSLDILTTDALQTLTTAACRLYTARREAGEDLAPVGKNALTATDVMVTASGLLQATNLAVFELGMWQGWTGR